MPDLSGLVNLPAVALEVITNLLATVLSALPSGIAEFLSNLFGIGVMA
jgi:hypothetical protein